MEMNVLLVLLQDIAVAKLFMKLYSYVVARDYGFAPNPFFRYCTLATCKPNIRRTAQIGDMIIGTGSLNYKIKGKLVFVMKVQEILNFDTYWEDLRFSIKRPSLTKSLKHAFGDNIYHRDHITGKWVQNNSHHSYEDGVPNNNNIKNDTKTNRVLISSDFSYWGGSGPQIPSGFRDWDGFDICANRNHKCNFPIALKNGFIKWYRSIEQTGFLSAPKEFCA
jgi:hypothetical protein